jgi:hypothetical protein
LVALTAMGRAGCRVGPLDAWRAYNGQVKVCFHEVVKYRMIEHQFFAS